MRMVAKKELFDLPVLGRAMREAGFIEVDRANRNQAIASLKDATRHLSEGVHLWVAPEGTRSETGELLPFKKGGFVIAMDMKAPIIPVTIRGTREVLRAHGLRSRRGAAVDVTLHPPVETAPYAERTDRKAARGEVMDAVRGAIASAL
jgi:1-acyl-sn-glycerol-3-phosphate acyltransferase